MLRALKPCAVGTKPKLLLLAASRPPQSVISVISPWPPGEAVRGPACAFGYRRASPATDIGSLQATAGPSTLFQVASQFNNCLELPLAPLTSPPSRAWFSDPTQGSADERELSWRGSPFGAEVTASISSTPLEPDPLAGLHRERRKWPREGEPMSADDLKDSQNCRLHCLYSGGVAGSERSQG